VYFWKYARRQTDIHTDIQTIFHTSPHSAPLYWTRGLYITVPYYTCVLQAYGKVAIGKSAIRWAIPHFLLVVCSNYIQTAPFSRYWWAYLGWFGSRVVSVLDSGAEGPGFKSQSRRCRVTVLGKLFTPIVPLFTKQQNW